MKTLEGPTPVSSGLLRGDTNSSASSPKQSGNIPFTNDGADDSSTQTEVEKWRLADEVEDFELSNQAGGRKLGVTWRDLTVQVVPSDERLNENVVSQLNLLQLTKDLRQKPSLKTVLESSSGCVRPGEMLLVLGRPGSGCTTLLKMLANKRKGYAQVDGDVHFGSLDATQAQQYRGSIVINNEEELFYPTLTVGETIDFATRLNMPDTLSEKTANREEIRHKFTNFLLKSMSIDHTKDTKVGDAYVRGVSGGERKRVSIVETLATRGSVICWDNSTRGLDASTALEFTRALRHLTDTLGMATIVTLYQAGNGIYNLFDKVLVLDEGKEIFYGPQEEAQPFMESHGFVCGAGANVADYLTGVTVPSERKIKPGFESKFPRCNTDIQRLYHQSDIKTSMDQELDYPISDDAKMNTQAFCEAIKSEKSRYLPHSSPMTVSYPAQVKACVIRQYQILWGDKPSLVIKQTTNILQALITGSLFYNAPDNSAGLFLKSGALFLALLFNGLFTLSEVNDSFVGRPILAKQKNFAFFNPAAFCIAQVIADIPILLFQITSFVLILYWMTALKATAAAFFTNWFVVYVVTIVMTAMMRAIGAGFPSFNSASKVSGFAITATIVYMGYEIPKPDMHPWFVWIYWINPMSYGFESLMANEYEGVNIPCVYENLIPNYLPQYQDPAAQACAGVRGARPGATTVSGEEYLTSLSYSPSNIWRNVAILFAWWAFFVGLTIFFTLRWSDTSSSSTAYIPREKFKQAARLRAVRHKDEEALESEKVMPNNGDPNSANADKAKLEGSLIRNTSIFTWRNLTYTVKTPSGDRKLLDNIHGFVKPGMLGALMGSSGAGKTTLLDVLAQRKTAGTIKGEILVDGRPLPVSFQRSAGYCEQLDVHDAYSTVREALEFSALLRQSRNTSKEEKLAYVNAIIDLLELHDLENTLIGRVGAGLSVEQRKRVTIGVELVSKPSILIFLDEPTSGLDGQAAFNTVRFLRKLADIGQAVLVTIHQPSALLFAEFDTLLLLAGGGKTVYFGEIGDNAATVKEYFSRYNAPCLENSNPAEHMIDVVSGYHPSGKDWHKIWLDSPEAAALNQHLDEIISDAAGKEPGTEDDGHEFATNFWTQTRLVTNRMNVSFFRDTAYFNNKLLLHGGVAFFIGFTFWQIGDSVAEQKYVLFSLFQYIFVAPGVIAQLQPIFLERRDIYETREKKSKMYSWVSFVTGLIVSEMPYLILCGVLYYLVFYFASGLPTEASKAGAVLFVFLVYQFIYTGFGQFVAAYAPNAVFASLVNPLLLSTLCCFCGVLVPYSQIEPFWRYWIYYLNPFNYLMGSLLVFTDFDWNIQCNDSEFAVFDPPGGGNQTCAQYLEAWLNGPGSRNNLINPEATEACRVCQYTLGRDYLATVNLTERYYGWRDAGICVIFSLSGYALVYLLMKLRTKASKKAEQ
ncbi:opaque-specific ABC transporter CDR3 [Plenodomus tracheiphilus IPT5]|uniref:Opaque-specific ABC transporter CDR3 n=1 Tax=Plenodomus tracheiphilus IPT5 TaxID=1408161 RepID=A0A6A7AXL1_9PLEO|nr:opaque-specific ABC transporter CDR3 [Plenodomus tracheiphilus IPT5]